MARQASSSSPGWSRSSAVGVTEGLTKLVDRDELEGVIQPSSATSRTATCCCRLSATDGGRDHQPVALRCTPAAAIAARTMAPLAQVNPLSAYRGGIASLFSTHPSTEERVARLQAIARGERAMA